MVFNKQIKILTLPLMVFALLAVSAPSTHAESTTSTAGAPTAATVQKLKDKCAATKTAAKDLANKKNATEKTKKIANDKADACQKKVDDYQAAYDKAQKAKGTKVKDYATCMVKVNAISGAALKQSFNKAVDSREANLGKIKKMANTLSDPAQKKTTLANIAADQKALGDIKTTGNAATTDDATIRSLSCKAIYGLQINQFRRLQVIYLKNMDVQKQRDSKFLALLKKDSNMPTATSIQNSAFKTDINQRLDSAREILRGNIALEDAGAAETVNAKITENKNIPTWTNNLKEPKIMSGWGAPEYRSVGNRKFQEAKYNYIEGIAIRKAGAQFRTDAKSPKVLSVKLKNKNDEILKSDGTLSGIVSKEDDPENTSETQSASAKDTQKSREEFKTDPLKVAVKATVELEINGTTYKKQLVRKNGDSKWEYANTKTNKKTDKEAVKQKDTKTNQSKEKEKKQGKNSGKKNTSETQSQNND